MESKLSRDGMRVEFDKSDIILIQNGCHMWLRTNELRGYVYNGTSFYYPKWWY